MGWNLQSKWNDSVITANYNELIDAANIDGWCSENGETNEQWVLFGTLIPEMGTEVEPMSVMPDISSEVNDLNPTIYQISTLYSWKKKRNVGGNDNSNNPNQPMTSKLYI
jgi:hypothetical protein